MTRDNNNVLFLTNLWVDQMVLFHVVYIWNPRMAKKYRMVSLMWISWTGCQLGAQGSSLCGLSTYLLGLPHKMAVRFQKAATQEAYAANLCSLSTCIASLVLHSIH